MSPKADHEPRTTDATQAFPCRLLIDPPADGAWNMAVDEALLDEAADAGIATMRWYRWSAPTLSLGYFQEYAEREDHGASRDSAVVRRLSGGGALLHDRELTYSMCLPAAHPLSRQSARLYGLAHAAIIEALGASGVTARLQGEGASQSIAGGAESGAGEPFLCFARRTPDDIVAPVSVGAGWAKIVGSAQRRRRGAVLQHGAILLDASPQAPELAGLAQCGASLATERGFIDRVCELLAAALHFRLFSANASTPKLVEQANSYLAKYGSSAWTMRR
jgi:lipoate-protein ligase A